MSQQALRFGTALRSPYDVAASAQRIEALGFDVLGCGEHVSFHGDTANGFVSLSVAAGATSRPCGNFGRTTVRGVKPRVLRFRRPVLLPAWGEGGREADG